MQFYGVKGKWPGRIKPPSVIFALSILSLSITEINLDFVLFYTKSNLVFLNSYTKSNIDSGIFYTKFDHDQEEVPTVGRIHRHS